MKCLLPGVRVLNTRSGPNSVSAFYPAVILASSCIDTATR
jgi:hypothetical protein